MAGTHGHFICFVYIFMLDLSIRKMSTALNSSPSYHSCLYNPDRLTAWRVTGL